MPDETKRTPMGPKADHNARMARWGQVKLWCILMIARNLSTTTPMLRFPYGRFSSTLELPRSIGLLGVREEGFGEGTEHGKNLMTPLIDWLIELMNSLIFVTHDLTSPCYSDIMLCVMAHLGPFWFHILGFSLPRDIVFCLACLPPCALSSFN